MRSSIIVLVSAVIWLAWIALAVSITGCAAPFQCRCPTDDRYMIVTWEEAYDQIKHGYDLRLRINSGQIEEDTLTKAESTQYLENLNTKRALERVMGKSKND